KHQTRTNKNGKSTHTHSADKGTGAAPPGVVLQKKKSAPIVTFQTTRPTQSQRSFDAGHWGTIAKPGCLASVSAPPPQNIHMVPRANRAAIAHHHART